MKTLSRYMRMRLVLPVLSVFLLGASVALPNIVGATGETITSSATATTELKTAGAITGITINGTGNTTVPVKLLVTSGTLAMSTTTGLTFTGGQTGSTLYFSGLRSDVNAALATLTYTRNVTGTDTLEISLVNSGEVFFSGTNHLYEYVSSTSDWNAARTAATGRTKYGATGYLATITSQAENDFVSDRLTGAGWMGASDSTTEGNWKWVTGPETGTQFWQGIGTGNTVGGNYANWNSGEPNDSSSNEDCGQFLAGGTGKWNDLPCSGSSLAGYVVEYGAPGNMPSVASANIAITTSDSVAPSAPGTPSTTTPTTNQKPAWSWTASSDSGTGLASPAYSLQWSQASDFSSGVSSATSATAAYTHATNLADGRWYFRVRASDVAGNNSAYSATASVLVDTTAPTAPGTSGATVYTTSTTPSLSWTASTDSGVGLTSPSYTVQYSQSSSFASGISSATTNSLSYTPSALAQGTWYFRVRAADILAQNSAWSTTTAYVIDMTAPSTPGTPTATTPTANQKPAWSWTASTDAGAGLANPAYAVQWSQDSTFATGVTSGTTNIASFTQPTDLSDGTWYFRICSSDVAGNTSAYATTGSVLIDTTAPSAPDLGAATIYTHNTTPTLAWNASVDSGAGLANPAYTVQRSQSSTFSSGVLSGTINSQTYTSPTLTDGTWYFRISGTDLTGNTSAWSATVTFVVDTSAPTTPGVPSTTTPTANQKPAWSWTASTDSGAGLDNPAYSVQWSLSSSFASGVTTATTNSNAFTQPTNLTDGTWYFRVWSNDVSGNNSAYSAAASVLIDAGAPSVPGAPNTGTPTANQKPVWSWTASTDAGVGLANPAYNVQWSQSSTFASGVTSATTNTASFTQPTNLSDGTWYFHVRSNDATGNTSAYSLTGSVVVDTAAPGLTNIVTTAATSTGQTISWTTDKLTASQIDYGPTTAYGESVTRDTLPRVAAHSVPLMDLYECTLYHYRIVSADALANSTTSADNTFITTGCAGAATVVSHTDTVINTSTGGTTSLTHDGETVSLVIPAQTSGPSADFQIKKLDVASAFTAIGSPSGVTPVGVAYDIKAMLDSTTPMSGFGTPVTVTMNYTADDIKAFIAGSLVIYRWDDGIGWQKLDACVTNAVINTVTCTTPGFSTFALFGTLTPVVTSTNQTSSMQTSAKKAAAVTEVAHAGHDHDETAGASTMNATEAPTTTSNDDDSSATINQVSGVNPDGNSRKWLAAGLIVAILLLSFAWWWIVAARKRRQNDKK